MCSLKGIGEVKMMSKVVVKDGLLIVEGDEAKITVLIIPDGGISDWVLEMSIPSAVKLIKLMLATMRKHGHERIGF